MTRIPEARDAAKSFMKASADGVKKLLNEECRRRHVTEDDQMETDWSKTSDRRLMSTRTMRPI